MALKNTLRGGLATVALLVALSTLGGCATAPEPDTAMTIKAGDPLEAAAADLLAGRFETAQAGLAEATARRPTDAARQTLLGMAFQMQAPHDPEALELAMVGYDTALSFQPAAYWPALFGGQAALERGRPMDAMDYFARAVLADPSSPQALEGLAAAAYSAGDAGLAREASLRAATLDPSSTGAWRIAALSAAALGDREEAEAALWSYGTAGGTDAGQLARRTDMLVLTSAAEQDYYEMSDYEMAQPEPSLSQVSIDVAIVLSQNTHRDRVGLNLLDGLRLQYGAQRQRFTTNPPGPDNSETQTTLSQAINIPELTWNLNLFNRFGQYYQVVARPSLTAYQGETSEFFIGRSLQIGVRGIESGQIEQVDIGIELKVTPIEIDGDRIVARIETGRSFVTTDPAGTFAEALSTFRQSVAATAEIRFGETLVLSGLSESVRDATGSKVPVAGSVPVVGSLFNERSTTERRDAVLILVTPSKPVSFGSEPWARPEAVARLVSLWDKVVDPSTNGSDVVARLSRVRMFSRMQQGDAPLMWGGPGQQAGEAVRDLLNWPE
ncbi:secretion protein [Parvularcula flava]|uniref:Secretion protein n=1 Tax=Aquisalinus luteolus TaxID=1566827 RepID=A0A8J3EQB3_9PROT|nr:secretion protein [Aquisalinus luteolus]NHK27036.1 secretion protein [Aquisalinus luteolus]GGH94169.1 hypothetical protein GCM10011355_07720 [Aquisalinus luteolus]